MTGVQIPNDQRAIGLCTCTRFTSIPLPATGIVTLAQIRHLMLLLFLHPIQLVWAVNFELTDTRAVRTQSSPPAPSAVTLRFEVASIKACKGEAAAAGQGQKGGNGGASSSPVTFNLPCMPVRFFINLAYVISNFSTRRRGGRSSAPQGVRSSAKCGPSGFTPGRDSSSTQSRRTGRAPRRPLPCRRRDRSSL